MTKIFVDSDIIIDLLARRDHYLEAARLLVIIREKGALAYTTPIVLANVHYIISRFANRQKSIKAIRVLRKYIRILSMNEAMVDRALESSFPDFEDALQYYAAEAKKMDFIVTRNKKDYRKGNKKIVNAQEFVDLHNADSDTEV